MKIEFTPAVRRKTKARVALCGPSGSGKTYTALAFAHVFAPGSIALIDTEKESADGYEGLNGWHWVSFKPVTYEPAVLVEALAAAAAAGIGCVVIDSLSHFWMGSGGMLEQVDNAAKRSRSGNSFAGWKEMRPDERRMLEALTGYPGHLIVTMRTKTEWVIQENDRGKKEPRRIGTKPEQREGIEYEFSVVADMDLDNTLTVSKTRVPTLKRAVVTEPGPEFAQKILDWLSEGGDALPDRGAWLREALEAAPKHKTLDACGDVWRESARRVETGDLAKADAISLQGVLRKRMEELKAAQQRLQASPGAGADPDGPWADTDPWADTVESLSDVTEAETLLADAEAQLRDGQIDAARYEQIEGLVKTRFPDAGASGDRAA